MGVIIEHFSNMRNLAKTKRGTIEKELESAHLSSIVYDKMSGTISYVLQINSILNLSDVKGIKFVNENNKLIISSQLQFYREFTVLVEDIYEDIYLLNDSDRIVKSIKNRVNCWKNFIGSGIGNGLTNEAEAGLFGELITLQNLINIEEDAAYVINSWVGPLFRPQDFILSDVSIESKTTLSKDNKTFIQIHGAEQLYSDRDLFLHVHFLTEGNNGKELKDLLEEIGDNLDENTAEEFFKKVAACGYSPEKKHQSGHKYSIDRSQLYKVEEGFPRQPIIPGITKVYYCIVLDAIRTFMRDNYR